MACTIKMRRNASKKGDKEEDGEKAE